MLMMDNNGRWLQVSDKSLAGWYVSNDSRLKTKHGSNGHRGARSNWHISNPEWIFAALHIINISGEEYW